MSDSPPRDYYRRNLPHYTPKGAVFFVTFCTDNARRLAEPQREIALGVLTGSHLIDVIIACVMPDHVHLIFSVRGEDSLAKVTQSLKGASARKVNISSGTIGIPVWQRESYDRVIRDGEELIRTIDYIEWNPVHAGLCARPGQYPYTCRADFSRLVNGLRRDPD